MQIREATREDAATITHIYNQGIEDVILMEKLLNESARATHLLATQKWLDFQEPV